MIAIAKLTVAGITKDQRYLVLGSQGNFIKTLADERIETACKKSYYEQMREGLEV